MVARAYRTFRDPRLAHNTYKRRQTTTCNSRSWGKPTYSSGFHGPDISHTHTHSYIQSNTHTQTYTNTQTYSFIHSNTHNPNMHKHSHTLVHTHKHTYSNIHKYTYTHMQTHSKYTHIHIHTYTETPHTRTFLMFKVAPRGGFPPQPQLPSWCGFL